MGDDTPVIFAFSIEHVSRLTGLSKSRLLRLGPRGILQARARRREAWRAPRADLLRSRTSSG